jgi:hypothetical protein
MFLEFSSAHHSKARAAVLFLVEQEVAANLVTVAYLIPVAIAATRWGI